MAFFFSNTFARFGQLEICEKDCFILQRVFYLANSLIKFVTGGEKTAANYLLKNMTSLKCLLLLYMLDNQKIKLG